MSLHICRGLVPGPPRISTFGFIYVFIFGCAGSSLLNGLFSSCDEWGLPFLAVRGLLVTVASLVAKHEL